MTFCPTAFVPRPLARALPAHPLRHMQVPPAPLRTRVDAQYFSLTRQGPCWENIVQTRPIGLYIPGAIPDQKPELFVVLQSWPFLVHAEIM